jgi:hypothetical protein
MKKIVSLLAIASILLTVSCKNDATSKIDENTVGTPPASPDAVLAPEPNIAPPPVPDVPAPKPPADGKYAAMTFAKSEHDFGKINEGDKVTYNFAFKNTGQADLLITGAKGSCGCTVPEFPKEPVKPGESGKIKVSFNSTGKPGQQHKTVTITANTINGTEKLNITANVTPKDGSNMTPVHQ